MDRRDYENSGTRFRAVAALDRAGDASAGCVPRAAGHVEPGDVERLCRVQPDRARVALDRILCGPHADRGLEEMRALGATSFFGSVDQLFGFGGGSQGHKDLWEHTKKVVAQADPRPVVRWAALFHDVGKVKTIQRDGGKISFHHHEVVSAKLFSRFADDSMIFRAPERERIKDVIVNLGRVEAFEGMWTDSAVRRLARELGDCLEDVIALSTADITTGRDSKRDRILRSIDSLRRRLEEVRREDEAPRLPKGLGTAMVSQLGFPQDASLRRAMDRLEEMMRSGEIPPGASVEDVIRAAREKGVSPSD